LFELLIKIETLPNSREIKWEEIAIEKYEAEIEESYIEKVKNQILRKFREYSEADKNYKVQIDDKVIVSYEGKIDGEFFEGNKEESVEMVIGSGNFFYFF
jgi:trigger factor